MSWSAGGIKYDLSQGEIRRKIRRQRERERERERETEQFVGRQILEKKLFLSLQRVFSI